MSHLAGFSRGFRTRKATVNLCPELLERFVACCPADSAGGVFHIILEDGNVHDEHVRACKVAAATDEERELAELLLRMSKTQRKKLGARWCAAVYGKGK